MRSRFSSLLRLRALVFGSAALALTLAASGCAEQRPDRNFVQADVVPKNIFDGKWYYQQTVVDISYQGASPTFIGEQSSVEIVRWELQEANLIAKRAYEDIAGSDFQFRDNDFLKGAPLASFAVNSHFDIQRGYNPLTGEQNNTIVENTQDRLWYERDFIRVDWSTSNVSNLEFFSLANAEADPLNYYVNRPDDPDRPIITNDYIEITTRWAITPETRELEGFGDIPVCFFYGEVADCASQIVSVRHSFRKYNEENDFVRESFTSQEMDYFGFFDTERKAYQLDYGLLEANRRRYRMIHNLWAKSRDAQGNPLPKYARTPKTVVYYVNKEHPRDLMNEAGLIGLGWDTAFKKAVNGMYAYYQNENAKAGEQLFALGGKPDYKLYDPDADKWCETNVETGRPDPDRCVANPAKSGNWNYVEWIRSLPAEEVAKMLYIVCPNNPVQEGDPAQCGEPGLSPRPGDIRYSLINYITAPQISSPAGYGPSNMDPLTGEILSATANTYGYVIEQQAARYTDFILLQTGRLTADDFVTGNNVRAERGEQPIPGYVNGLIANAPSNIANGTAETMYTAADIRSIRERTLEHVRSAQFGPVIDPTRKDISVWDQMRDRQRYLEQMGVLDTGAPTGDAKLQKLMQMPFAQKLLNREMTIALSDSTAAPDQAVAAERLAKFPAMMRELNDLKFDLDTKLMTRSICMVQDAGISFSDQSIQGLVREMEDLYGDLEGFEFVKAVRAELRRRMYRSVQEHEVGHTVGLRHQFVASFDATNWNDKYWELRKKFGKSKLPAGNGLFENMGPRGPDLRTDDPSPVDPVTQEEINSGMDDYRYSSIMEYPSGWHATLKGLGKYDIAAIKFGYTGMVEIFNELGDLAETESQKLQFALTANDWRKNSQPWVYINNDTVLHYTDMPAVYGDLSEANKTDVPWDYIMDYRSGLQSISPRKMVYCGRPKEEALARGRLCAGGNCLNDDNPSLDISENDCTDDQKVMNLYMFCSDEFRGSGVTCRIFDEGADIYEQQAYFANAYRNYYLINAFKRDRVGFGMGVNAATGYMSRLIDRYFEPMRDTYSWYNLYSLLFAGDATAEAFLLDPKSWGTLTAGTYVGFDTLTRVLVWPQPGSFITVEDQTGERYLVNASDNNDIFASDPNSTPVAGPRFTVPLIDGKFYETEWDSENGGYFWFEQVKYMGSFFDKLVALDLLTQEQAYFIGRDSSTDVRRYRMSYYNYFAKSMNQLMRGAMGDKLAGFAPRVINVGGKPTMQMPRLSTDLEIRPVTDNDIPLSPRFDQTLQMYALLFMAARYDYNWVQQVTDGELAASFDELISVWRKGSWLAREQDNLVEYVDPFDGTVWQAIAFAPLNDGNEIGIGAAMLAHANALKARITELETSGGSTENLIKAKSDLRQHVDMLTYVSEMVSALSSITQSLDYAPQQ